MSSGPLGRALVRLEADVQAAEQRWREARELADRDPWQRVRDVAEPLTAYLAGVQHRRHELDPEKRARMTADLLERIATDGFTLDPLPGQGIGVVRITDPRPDQGAASAYCTLREAKRRLDEFAQTNAAGLQAERDRDRMERVREAIRGDDPAALVEALAS